MMPDLVKNYIILFFDGGTQQITKEQSELLFHPEVQARGIAKLDGLPINLKSISRVLPLAEYYQQFPEKRPAPPLQNWSGGYLTSGWRKENRRDALESMIRGMKNYIASPRYQGTEAPHELLKQMELRLKAL